MTDQLTSITAFVSRTTNLGINPAILWDIIENRELRAPLRGTSVNNDPHGNHIRIPNGRGGSIKVRDNLYPEDIVYAALHHYLTNRSEGLDVAMESAAKAEEVLDPETFDGLADVPYVDEIATGWITQQYDRPLYVTWDGWVVEHEGESWVVTGHYGEYRGKAIEQAKVALRL